MDKRRARTRKRKEEKQKRKQMTIMISFVGLFVLMLILTIKLVSINDTEIETSNFNVINEVLNVVDNEAEENTENEEKVINTDIEEKTDVDTEEQEKNASEEISFESYKNETDNRERAVEIAKENWGEDTTVYFTIDENDYKDEDGNYIVSIRDNATTREIERCKVNLETETCTY